MSAWDDLNTELDMWSDLGATATMWWRDDAAVAHTPALHQLYTLSSNHRVPLTLAVIPNAAEAGLCTGPDTPEHLCIVQHGYAHQNHEPDGVKKSEFGSGRDKTVINDELAAGQATLSAFPGFFPAFVPPWNRVSPDFHQNFVDSSIVGLSTFGARQQRETVPGLIQVNTHADIVDWRGSRGFAGENHVCGQICNHLIARRSQKCDGSEPTGVLSHHLVHDDECWHFLDTLFSTLNEHSAVRWLNGAEVFAV